VTKPMMNLDEVEFDDVEDNGVYTSKRGQISDHIGARKLGYNLTVLPPGKNAVRSRKRLPRMRSVFSEKPPSSIIRLTK